MPAKACRSVDEPLVSTFLHFWTILWGCVTVGLAVYLITALPIRLFCDWRIRKLNAKLADLDSDVVPGEVGDTGGDSEHDSD